MMLRRFKSALSDIPSPYFFIEINPFVITNESFRHLTQMSDARMLSHLVGGEERRVAEADCGLPFAINKSRYISFLPIPFTLLIENN